MLPLLTRPRAWQIAAVIALAACDDQIERHNQELARKEAFQAKMGEYSAIVSAARAKEAAQQCVRGKVVPVYAGPGGADFAEDVYGELPSELQAKDPSEVQTVAAIETDDCSEYVDRSTNARLKLCQTMRVVCVDKDARVAGPSQELRGPSLPQDFAGTSGDRYRRERAGQVAAHIAKQKCP